MIEQIVPDSRILIGTAAVLAAMLLSIALSVGHPVAGETFFDHEFGPSEPSARSETVFGSVFSSSTASAGGETVFDHEFPVAAPSAHSETAFDREFAPEDRSAPSETFFDRTFPAHQPTGSIFRP